MTNYQDFPSISKKHVSGKAEYNQQWTWRSKWRIWDNLFPYGHPTNVSSENDGWYFHPDYSSKASLIQTQRTGENPDKEVDMIQNPTTTSVELHSTNL